MQAIKYPRGIAPLGTLKTRILIAEGFQNSADKWFPNGAPDTLPSGPLGIYGPLNAYLANGADDDTRLQTRSSSMLRHPKPSPGYRVPTLHHLTVSDSSHPSAGPAQPRHVGDCGRRAPIGGAAATSACHRTIRPPSARARRSWRDAQARRLRTTPRSRHGRMRTGPSTGNLFPRRFTLNAALLALRKWAGTGAPAPSAPRISVSDQSRTRPQRS